MLTLHMSVVAFIETTRLQGGSHLLACVLARTHKRHVHVAPHAPPPPPPIPMSTVNSPTTMLFGGGSGTKAPGSMTMSPTRAAGLPPIRTMPEPPSGTGVVTPGP